MWPRVGSSKFVSQWITVTVVASLFATFDGGWLLHWASLAPSKIWHGQIWRLVTWPVIEQGPLGIVVTCIAIYKFGGELAVRWGDRRLRRFTIEVVLAASIVTTLLAGLAGHTYLVRVGGWAITDALLVAWARQFPYTPVQLYQFLTLQGRQLVMFTVGVAVLFAVYYGPVAMAPELVACAIAAWYPSAWLARR